MYISFECLNGKTIECDFPTGQPIRLNLPHPIREANSTTGHKLAAQVDPNQTTVRVESPAWLFSTTFMGYEKKD